MEKKRMKIPRKSQKYQKTLNQDFSSMKMQQEEMEFEKKQSSNADGVDNPNEKSLQGSKSKQMSGSIYNTEGSGSKSQARSDEVSESGSEEEGSDSLVSESDSEDTEEAR